MDITVLCVLELIKRKLIHLVILSLIPLAFIKASILEFY